MPSRGVEEGFQMPFGSMPEGASPTAISEKPPLSQQQRITITVEALNSGLNPPLPKIIRGIRANRSAGGTNTTILWLPKADGTKGSFEVTLDDLETIKRKRITASKNHAPRRRRFTDF